MSDVSAFHVYEASRVVESTMIQLEEEMESEDFKHGDKDFFAHLSERLSQAIENHEELLIETALTVMNLEAEAKAYDDALERISLNLGRAKGKALKLRKAIELTLGKDESFSCPERGLAVVKRVGVKGSVQLAEGCSLDDIANRFIRRKAAPPPELDKTEVAAAMKRGDKVTGCVLVKGTRLKIE